MAQASRRFLETPWHECAQGAAVALYRARTPPPASLARLQPGLQFAISLGAGPELQEMFHPLPARKEPLGGQTCVGTRAFWPSSPGERAGPGVLHKRAGMCGVLLHNPIWAQQGGRVERPLEAPQALMPGQGNHSLKVLGF